MFMVHADNWAQIPTLNPSKKGATTLEGAIAEAKRVLRAGGDTAHDTVRVYTRPRSAAWLSKQNALAAVRRTGRGFDVKVGAEARS